MKSGLEGRNNGMCCHGQVAHQVVSMKSGLEGRNNLSRHVRQSKSYYRLNEVRPRRPEQSGSGVCAGLHQGSVSMKSGLEGRNNNFTVGERAILIGVSMKSGLEGRNNVLEQYCYGYQLLLVSMKSGLEGRNNSAPTIAAAMPTSLSQ